MLISEGPCARFNTPILKFLLLLNKGSPFYFALGPARDVPVFSVAVGFLFLFFVFLFFFFLFVLFLVLFCFVFLWPYLQYTEVPRARDCIHASAVCLSHCSQVLNPLHDSRNSHDVSNFDGDHLRFFCSPWFF